MELYEIIPGKLYQSPQIDTWAVVQQLRPQMIICLSSLDAAIPGDVNEFVYTFWPIADGPLPNLRILRRIAELAVAVIDGGGKVLSHCAAGINRASLMNGSILYEMTDLTGPDVVALLRQKRPGALTNQTFAAYLQALQ